MSDNETRDIVTIDGAVVSFDVRGDGPSVLLLHAGIADRRMWDMQMASFSGDNRVIRCDLPGFGASRLPASGQFAVRRTIAYFMDEIEASPAIVLGCSYGAGVTLELAVERPDLVRALILVCPAMAGHPWSRAILLAEEEIERALEIGDLHSAAEVDVRVWVDGPYRSPEQVDPDVRSKALAMARGVYEVATGEPLPELTPIPLDPPLTARLGAIKALTLIITGELDQPDVRAISNLLADHIPDARSVEMSGAAHLLSMEQPDAFNAIVLAFLDEIRDGAGGGEN